VQERNQGCLTLILQLLGIAPSRPIKRLPDRKRTPEKQRNKRAEPAAFDAAIYTLKPSLLSNAEASFWGVLLQCMPDDLTAFAKVGVGDVVDVRGGGKWHASNVRKQHFDFVLCCSRTLRAVVVVELDDASHAGEKAKKMDAQKDAVCLGAGLPIVRVRAAAAYAPREIARLINGARRQP